MNSVINQVLLTVVVSLVAISSSNSNYGYGQQFSNAQCNRDAFNRAQNNIRLEIQQRNPNQQPGAPYDSSYTGVSNGFQANNQATTQLGDYQCRQIRQYFNDLVSNTPLCESPTTSSYGFTNVASLIDQARRFLQQYCERNQGHQHLQCYKGHEMIACESQFSFARSRAQQSVNSPVVGSGYNGLQSSSYSSTGGIVTYELCQAYENFRNCVDTAVRRSCYNLDHEHAITYLVDHARQLAYSCPPYQTVINSGLIPGSSYPGRRTDLGPYPSQNQNNYPNLAYPTSFNSRNLPTHSFGSNQLGDTSRMGSAIIDNSHGICMDRVRPYVDSCRDLMEQRQREVRYGRSSNDVQRRICCALFWYRDCVSRTVLDHCVDGTRTVVDLLMQDHQRSLATCRDYNRDQCSGVSALQGSMMAVLMATLLVTFFHH